LAEETNQDARPGSGSDGRDAVPRDGAGNSGVPPADKDSITIHLEAFEGPLDLLLHLIKREEVDISNIPIARITEQYLRHLDMMKDLNINVAGDWLVMAATLIFIKSRMLLPPDPVVEGAQAEEDDPRTELVYQLLEHQKFKNAAHMLYEREEIENAVWNHPPAEVLEEGKDLVLVTLFDLLRAFHEVVKRFEHNRPWRSATKRSASSRSSATSASSCWFTTRCCSRASLPTHLQNNT